MPSTKSDLVELEMVIHQDNDRHRAIFASTTGDIDDAVWLPRDLIEVEMTGPSRANIVMPQWLSENRRLV
jgi:hypothetical protein